jgi:transcriptional regulator with XRE-family HTH domain
MESVTYTGCVPTAKNRKPAIGTATGAPQREPSSLVKHVMEELELLQERRGLTQKAMMKAAGSTQQAWSRWTKGSEPGVNLLANVANALDAELVVKVRDRRQSETGGAAAEPSLHRNHQDIELAEYLAVLPEPKRESIVKWVKSLAEAYLATAAKKQATRAK